MLAGQPVTDPRVLADYAALGRRLGLRRLPRLLLSEEAGSPVLAGIIPPALLFPPPLLTTCSAGEVTAILAHELAHLKRCDLLWAWLPALAQVSFFFHPLVWLTRREWRLAHEIACDELAAMDRRNRALQEQIARQSAQLAAQQALQEQLRRHLLQAVARQAQEKDLLLRQLAELAVQRRALLAEKVLQAQHEALLHQKGLAAQHVAGEDARLSAALKAARQARLRQRALQERLQRARPSSRPAPASSPRPSP